MKFTSFVKRLVLSPLCLLIGTLGDIDEDELARAVEKRTARAQRAVIRDYLSQHGVEGEAAEEAMESLRERLCEKLPSREKLDAVSKNLKRAESELKRTRFESALKLRLAREGVSEKYCSDIMYLAEKELEQSGETGEEAAGRALDAVLERFPVTPERLLLSAGAKGNYPRQDDAQALYSHRLESARASGDNAAAVRIINDAAENGVTLR